MSPADPQLTPAESALLDQCEAAVRDAHTAGLFNERWKLKHQIFDASDLVREALARPEAEDIRNVLQQADRLLDKAAAIIEGEDDEGDSFTEVPGAGQSEAEPGASRPR